MRSATAAAIGAWSPRRCAPEVAAFSRRVVASAQPSSLERAKALLFAAAKLADFGLSIGLELDETVLLRASVIERFCTSPHAASAATRRTLRSNLRFLARAVLTDRRPHRCRFQGSEPSRRTQRTSSPATSPSVTPSQQGCAGSGHRR